MDPASLPVGQRVALLVKALNGAKRTNEALARCCDGDGMVEVLLDASRKLGLGLTRYELLTTPPIRDWIWWKNKEALLTIGDNKPRYQQDGSQGRPAGGLPAGGGGSSGEQAGGEGDDRERNPERKRFFGLF